MEDTDKWLLPAGIEDDLPPLARRTEALRRRVLDLFDAWGYDLVCPPLIEYLDSLLVAGDKTLDLQTFKLTDQLNGRLMGLRADLTPQVARIDAHRLAGARANRLCYIGAALRTLPDGAGGTRAPLQFGAELYGCADARADIEIVRLMLASLDALGVAGTALDLGHVGIYAGLARDAGLDPARERELFELLQKKAKHEIAAFLDAGGVAGGARHRLLALADLHGADAPARARAALAGAGAAVGAALDELEAVARGLHAATGVEPHYDLAELRGYHYQTGVVFAAFAPGVGQEIARGGRYDEIGSAFGRTRPASGFSGDMHLIATLVDTGAAAPRGIYAPPDDDPALAREIATLRARGERVIEGLAADENPRDFDCDRRLERAAGGWRVRAES